MSEPINLDDLPLKSRDAIKRLCSEGESRAAILNIHADPPINLDVVINYTQLAWRRIAKEIAYPRVN